MCCHCCCCCQARQAKEAAQREANFQTLYCEVLEGMQQDTGILAEVQEVLDQADQAHHDRQAELYQQWSSQVFDKIQVRQAYISKCVSYSSNCSHWCNSCLSLPHVSVVVCVGLLALLHFLALQPLSALSASEAVSVQNGNNVSSSA
jgi:hypothetical protein